MEKSSSSTGAVPKEKNQMMDSSAATTTHRERNVELEIDVLQKNLQESIARFPDFKGMNSNTKPVSKNYMKNPLLFHQLKSLGLFTWREKQPFPGTLSCSLIV